jgi:hypothetical protein
MQPGHSVVCLGLGMAYRQDGTTRGQLLEGCMPSCKLPVVQTLQARVCCRHEVVPNANGCIEPCTITCSALIRGDF